MNTKTKQLSEKIIEFLMSNGNNGKFEITEESIAARFKVSRTPVREVLKHLEHEGLIQTRRSRGITFKQFSEQDVKNVYAVRLAMEKLALQDAISNITPRVIRLMKSYGRKYMKARSEGDFEEAKAVDMLFHETILDLSENQYLNHMVKKIRLFTTSFSLPGKTTFSTSRDANPVSHGKIIEALSEGDVHKAEKLLCEHIIFGRDSIIKDLKRR